MRMCQRIDRAIFNTLNRLQGGAKGQKVGWAEQYLYVTFLYDFEKIMHS